MVTKITNNNNLMIYVIFIHLLFALFSDVIVAQDYTSERLSVNVSLSFMKTGGDLNKFWGDGFSPGINFEYLLNERVSLSASFSGSYFSPKKQYSTDLYPEIYYLNLSGELIFKLLSSRVFSVSGTGGIISGTFLFTGEAEDLVSTNDSESEFGLSAGILSAISIQHLPEFRLFLKLNSIFSAPTNINFLLLGISVVFI
ncbi:MAG: hypothetical protein Kow0098_16330 [Ignavibacteriaceae bacterium]